jgi:hypothetical protein
MLIAVVKAECHCIAVTSGQNNDRNGNEDLKGNLPIALPTAILLRLVRVGIDGSSLGEVFGKYAVLLAVVVLAVVVFVAVLVGAGHC